MIISWDRFKGDSMPWKIDTSNINCNWVVVEDVKGRLSFVHKTEDVIFSISKRDRKGYFKFYKSGKLLSKSRTNSKIFIEQFF